MCALKYQRIYTKKNRKKINARQKLNANLEKYPLAPACEFCGVTQNLEHAHIDYDYPTLYVTACGSCNMWMENDILAYGATVQSVENNGKQPKGEKRNANVARHNGAIGGD